MFDLDTTEAAWYDAKAKVWHGPKFHDLYDRNASVGHILFEQMRRRPKSICQISDTEHTSLTNEDALLHAIRIAEWFRSQRFTQRDVVGVVGRNTTHVLAVVLACFFNGHAVQAINPVREEKLIKSLFGHTKPKIVFFDGQDFEKIKSATSELQTSLLYTLSQHLPNVPTVIDLLQPTGTEHSFVPAILENGLDHTLAILCSSGSTGLPKAVTISNNKRYFDIFPFLHSEDVLVVLSTIDWFTGILYLVVGLASGAKRVITEKPFDPAYFLTLVSEYKATFVMIAPPLLATLLNCPTIHADQLDSMRYMIFGGGKCTTRITQRMQSYLRNGLMIFVYGLTEFGRILSMNFKLSEKQQAVGRLQPGYKVKLLNDRGEQLGVGVVGEICCYHGEGWQGYCGNSAESETVLDAEGWFHTGDLGCFDSDGYLSVVDRKKDVLKYKGMQYSPNEIEEVIAKMPKVLDSCIFGLWNEEEGDAAAAVVAKEQGSSLKASDVISYVKEHIEVDYKHLHGGVVIVDELPKLPNGKRNIEEIKKIFHSAQRTH